MADTKEIFAERLKKALKNKGMQQNTFAKEIDLSCQAVSNFCSGKNLPTVESLVLISQTLNISIDDLLGNTGVLSTQKKHPVSELLNAMVTIADELNLGVVAHPDCEYHIVYKTFENAHSFEEEAKSASIASFFDSWIKYRELLKEGHITIEEYNSLTESRIRRT